MIRAEVEASGVVLAATLPEGAVAYVDRDWLPASSGEASSLVATPDGALAWCGNRRGRMPADLDPDTVAALALLAVAYEAAAAVDGVPAESIEVTGNGLIARQVRALVVDRSAADRRSTLVEQPSAIVETTGDPSVIRDAIERSTNLGTLVLAGESVRGAVDLNLYPHVHMRGLTLVGVPPPWQRAGLPNDINSEDPLLESSLELLVRVSPGASLPGDAAWFRLSG